MTPGMSGVNSVTCAQLGQGMLRHLQASFTPDSLKQRGVVLGHDHRSNTDLGLSSAHFCDLLSYIFATA